jgi:hypothetical protein
MWVRPRPLERGSYITLNSDNFFELLQKQKGFNFLSFFNNDEYFITIKDKEHTVVAVASTKSEIETAWNWISEKFSKTLSTYVLCLNFVLFNIKHPFFSSLG